MKIAHVITELGPGGAERVVLELCKELKKNGHAPVIISLSPKPENSAIPAALEKAGLETHYANVSKKKPWTIFNLASILRKTNPDIVHAHLMHPSLATRLLKPFYRKPLVNTIHIADRRRRMWPWFMADRITFPLCDICTAVSKAAAAFHEKSAGLTEGSIKVIYNGVDKVKPAPAEELEKLRRDWQIGSCSRVIGSIGRLDWQKGFDILFSMLPELSLLVPPGERWAIVIIGEGPERGLLEKLAADAPANIEIKMPGFRADASRVMALFDAFVMPSRYEGYGLALAEAMSLGLPVVTNEIDSLPELCDLYPNSQCVRFPSPDASAAIAAALETPRGEPFEIMSVAKMTSEYQSIYSSLV